MVLCGCNVAGEGKRAERSAQQAEEERSIAKGVAGNQMQRAAPQGNRSKVQAGGR